MINNYLKVATRNIVKRKLYSFINAFGLSVAIAFCSLIYLYIRDEKSFDQFHKNKELIFRMHSTSFNRESFEKDNTKPYSSHAYLPAPLGERMLDELAEVEHMTRYNSWGEGVMTYNDKVFKQKFAYADSGFFKMFSFTISSGSTRNIFKNKTDAVLTKATAEKYFGDEDPIGKVFTLDANDLNTMTVVAVIEVPPTNSSIGFEMLVPLNLQTWLPRNRENWGSFSYPTFVQLRPNTDLSLFKTHVDSLVQKYAGEKYEGWRDRSKIPPEFKVNEFNFMSLNDIHLSTEVSWEKGSDPKYSWILGGIAILILVIACINYISLALTTSASRRVEVGIRKVVGAQKRQLIYQFGIESIVLAFLSMAIGVGLVALFLPSFNSFTGKEIELTGLFIAQGLGMVILITLLVGMVAGSYPSLYLSRFLPASVLKGRLSSRVHAGFTRPLVVIQFFLSASMIICSIIMYQQMNFITTKDLGYDKEQVIVLETHSGYGPEGDGIIEQLRNTLKSEPSVISVSGTSSSFNQGWSRYGYRIEDENKSAYVYRVDPYYLPLLGIELVEGRNFDEGLASDTTALIVNEALVKDMGWTDPLNEYLNWREDSLGPGSKIIGVAKDYHFMSLEREIEPMFLSMDKKNVGYMTVAMVKLAPGDLAGKLEKVKTVWGELYPDKPFTYTFVDEDVARQYESYNRWMKIMGLSTVFAIVIACLGLFGLAGINAVNRTKEIGIRKVMGAELSNIFVLLNRQYVLLAIIAFILAAPLSWYTMNNWWLSGFEFKVTIGWEIFALSMLAGLLIALLTVSYHAIKVALVNPAETLTHE
jgi:putative ABC transport system permease protein